MYSYHNSIDELFNLKEELFSPVTEKSISPPNLSFEESFEPNDFAVFQENGQSQQQFLEQSTCYGHIYQNQHHRMETHVLELNMDNQYLHNSSAQSQDSNISTTNSNNSPVINKSKDFKSSLPLQMKPKRSRTVFTYSQLLLLEKEFQVNKFLCRPRRIEMAQSLKITERQLRNWFQNRRMKLRKQLAAPISPNENDPLSSSPQSVSANLISPPNYFTPLNYNENQNSHIPSFLGTMNPYNSNQADCYNYYNQQSIEVPNQCDYYMQNFYSNLYPPNKFNDYDMYNLYMKTEDSTPTEIQEREEESGEHFKSWANDSCAGEQFI